MIYIISGASRSGKTKVGKTMMKRLDIPHIEVDNIMMAFNLGMPETTINHEEWPHVTAKKMKPFLQAYIKTCFQGKKSVILEGEQFTVQFIRDILDKYPNTVRACFMGFTDISLEEKEYNVKTFVEEDDWLLTFDDDYITDHVKNMIEYSVKIKKECEEFNVQYFDTSSAFIEKIETVISYLLK